MKDEKFNVSIGCVVAYGMWFVAVSLFTGVVFTGEIRILAGGFLAMGIAATATVRTYFVGFSTMVSKAFESDPDSVTTLPTRR